MSEASAAVARFDFTSGAQRGTHLILYGNCLVHRGDAHVETMPLAAMAAVRVAFERDQRKLGWAVSLFVVALLLFVVSGPLAAFGSSAAGEMTAAGGQGVARALYLTFKFLEALGNFMPVAGFAALVAGIGLGALAWFGSTILTLDLAGAERRYAVRGHDTKLLDFADAVAEKLMTLKRA